MNLSPQFSNDLVVLCDVVGDVLHILVNLRRAGGGGGGRRGEEGGGGGRRGEEGGGGT